MAKTNNKQYAAKITIQRYVQTNPVLHRVPKFISNVPINNKEATYVPPTLERYIVIGYWPNDYTT
jgi:hypothetical protein